MTGVPPLAKPGLQLKPTLVVSVIDLTLTRSMGASGFVRRIPPLPGYETGEVFTALTAAT